MLTDRQSINLLREMIRIRRFEQAALRQYNQGKMGGWLLLDIGQESIAVATRAIMGKSEHSISGPRGLAHAIAAGADLGAIMAEFFGKVGGTSQGKAGQFSQFQPKLNHWGSWATAAAQTPLAAGLAFAAKYREQPSAVFCFLGDGAMNQGVFHETLNLAGLFDLPVVFVVENNGYALGTSVPRSSSFRESLAKRAEAYDIEWERATAWKIEEMIAKLQSCRTRAVEQSRPTVVEIATYRYYGFSVADANAKKYRTPEEIEYYRTHHDPVRIWANQLVDRGMITIEAYEQLDVDAKREARAAAAFAEQSPAPLPVDLKTHIYWECDHETASSQQGVHFFS